MRSGWRNWLRERKGASREGQSRWDGRSGECRDGMLIAGGCGSVPPCPCQRKEKVLGFPPPHQSPQRCGGPLLPQLPETSRLVLLPDKNHVSKQPIQEKLSLQLSPRAGRPGESRAGPGQLPALPNSGISHPFEQQLASTGILVLDLGRGMLPNGSCSPTPPRPPRCRRGSSPPSLCPSPSGWGLVPEGACQP